MFSFGCTPGQVPVLQHAAAPHLLKRIVLKLTHAVSPVNSHVLS